TDGLSHGKPALFLRLRTSDCSVVRENSEDPRLSHGCSRRVDGRHRRARDLAAARPLATSILNRIRLHMPDTRVPEGRVRVFARYRTLFDIDVQIRKGHPHPALRATFSRKREKGEFCGSAHRMTTP